MLHDEVIEPWHVGLKGDAVRELSDQPANVLSVGIRPVARKELLQFGFGRNVNPSHAQSSLHLPMQWANSSADGGSDAIGGRTRYSAAEETGTDSSREEPRKWTTFAVTTTAHRTRAIGRDPPEMVGGRLKSSEYIV